MSAVRVAARDDGFPYVAGAAALLVVIGTLTYSVSQDWSLVDGFYFAVATLTTSSVSDPDLVLEGAPIKLFTVLYILVGIGLLVELARQLGVAFVEVRKDAIAQKRSPSDEKTSA